MIVRREEELNGCYIMKLAMAMVGPEANEVH